MNERLRISIASFMSYAPPWSKGGVRNLIRSMAHDFRSRGAEITVIGHKGPSMITTGDAGERIITLPSSTTWPKWPRVIKQSGVWLASARAILSLGHGEKLRERLEANCARVDKRLGSRVALDNLFDESVAISGQLRVAAF